VIVCYAHSPVPETLRLSGLILTARCRFCNESIFRVATVQTSIVDDAPVWARYFPYVIEEEPA